jgi:hypothetical protein
VRSGFGVNRDDVGASFGKLRYEGISRSDHQVAIEDLLRSTSDRSYYLRAKRDVRYEMTIHHVEMNPIGASFVDRANFLA